MGIVDGHGGGKGAGGHFQFAFHFLPGVAGAGDGDAGKVHRLLEMGKVEQEVDLAARLIHRAAADPAVIAILVDEALPPGVDEDAIGMAFRHGPWAGGEELVHVDGITARAHAELDAAAIVLVTDGIAQLQRFRAILAPHRLVEHEAAGGEHYAFRGFHEAWLVVDADDHADDARAILHQRQRPGIDDNFHAARPGGGLQDIDQRPPATPAHVLDDVAARGGFGQIAERLRRFAAGPDQGGIVGRLDQLAGQVIAAIGHALRLQPGIVAERLGGIEIALGIVRARPAGCLEIGGKLFGSVLEACRALGVGTATDVDFATRKGGRPAAARIALEQHDPGAGVRRLYGGTGAGRAEADHGNVRLEIPGRHFAGGIGPVQRNLGHRLQFPCAFSISSATSTIMSS